MTVCVCMRLRCLVVKSSLQTCYIAYWYRATQAGYLCLKLVPLCLKVDLRITVVYFVIIKLTDVVVVDFTERRERKRVVFKDEKRIDIHVI